MRRTIVNAVAAIALCVLSAQAVDPIGGRDADCSQAVNVADVTYLVDYLFLSGPAPCPNTGAGANVIDSVWYTADYWGIARGNCGNKLWGDSAHTMVNLGVACTTGQSDIAESYVTISGGRHNVCKSFSGTIAGGWDNLVSQNYGAIGGGGGNQAGAGATIAGGFANKATASAVVGGGEANEANGSLSSIGGGDRNVISHLGLPVAAVISGGSENLIFTQYSTIPGGRLNGAGNSFLEGSYTTVGGGYSNICTGDSATIGGGSDNFLGHAALNGTIGGGARNNLGGNASTIGGGLANECQGIRAVIGGGISNTIGASGGYSAIAGGSGNNSQGEYTAIGGGANNTANTHFSWIGGGQNNTTKGLRACVPGGENNVAAGDYSFACGKQAKALHAGSFVWADVSGGDLESTSENQFLIRASGGTTVYPNESQSAGVTVHPGASAWAVNSDRNLKENLVEMDGDEILDKIESLPIVEWNYKTQDDGIRHLGPMVQDFHAIFGLGDDSVTISTMDPSGVALAGVKELVKKNRELQVRIVKQESLVKTLLGQQHVSSHSKVEFTKNE